MSFCWSENAQIHKKSNFPYTLAAKLSTLLRRKVTHEEVGVVLTLVHDEQSKVEELDSFIEDFANDDGVVILREKTSSLGCVLQSQLSRMFVFKHEFIDEDDVIITSDVDIFPMDKRIVEPLQNKSFTIWIYRHGLTKETGATFAMSIIGMRSKDWRQVLDYSYLGVDQDVFSIVSHFNHTFHFNSEKKSWWVDQVLISHAILSHGYCSLPNNNRLWRQLQLSPLKHKPGPSMSCFKGEVMHCNKKRKSQKGGCLHWHFHPDEREQDLHQKYFDIIQAL